MTDKEKIKSDNFGLMKEIATILLDYNLNSTRTETTEQYAEKIIEIVEQKMQKLFEEKIKKWFRKNNQYKSSKKYGFYMYDSKLQELLTSISGAENEGSVS